MSLEFKSNGYQIVNNSISKIAYKTNDDISTLVEGYLKGGLKFIKRTKTKRTKRTRRRQTRKTTKKRK